MTQATVSKKREGDARYGPLWRILINGKPSPFAVTKSIPPKYGRPQMWDVLDGDDEDTDLLFETNSLEGALQVVQSIAQATCTLVAA